MVHGRNEMIVIASTILGLSVYHFRKGNHRIISFLICPSGNAYNVKQTMQAAVSFEFQMNLIIFGAVHSISLTVSRKRFERIYAKYQFEHILRITACTL